MVALVCRCSGLSADDSRDRRVSLRPPHRFHPPHLLRRSRAASPVSRTVGSARRNPEGPQRRSYHSSGRTQRRQARRLPRRSNTPTHCLPRFRRRHDTGRRDRECRGTKGPFQSSRRRLARRAIRLGTAEWRSFPRPCPDIEAQSQPALEIQSPQNRWRPNGYTLRHMRASSPQAARGLLPTPNDAAWS